MDTFNSGNIYVGGRTCVLTSPSNKEVMFWHDLITKKFGTQQRIDESSSPIFPKRPSQRQTLMWSSFLS